MTRHLGSRSRIAARGVGAVQLRHREMSMSTRPERASRAWRTASRPSDRERDHLHVGCVSDHVLEPFGHHAVVVGDEDADRHG
jgi:hypothetical protein